MSEIHIPDEIIMRRVEDLIPYARNSRTHSAEQVAKLAASIKEFGWTVPILVDGEGTIVAGHGRVMAARKLKIDVVPTIDIGHLSDAQRRAYVIADNRLALDAGWDDEMLRVELGDLTGAGFDLALTGLSEEEINRLSSVVEVLDPVGDEDAIPEAQPDPVSRPGDVWILGRHRVICGDATNPDDVERVLSGAKADIVFTSPPYALGDSIKLSGNKKKSADGNAYEDHKDSADEWMELMSGWWAACLPFVEHGIFVNVQLLANNKRLLLKWIEERSNRLCDFLTWAKTNAQPAMHPGVMTSSTEWVVIFGKELATRVVPCSSWRGNVSTVYQTAIQGANEHAAIHAATFPVHLPEFVLGKLADKTGSVLDPFCGTGTTVIAAEKLARTAYGVEIDPRYVDVIVKRWQDYTGKAAILESSGRTFDEEGGEG